VTVFVLFIIITLFTATVSVNISVSEQIAAISSHVQLLYNYSLVVTAYFRD